MNEKDEEIKKEFEEAFGEPIEETQNIVEQVKEFYWLDTKRFLLIGMFLTIMFIVFMAFLYLKADEVTRDPCSICSEYMGENVVCIAGLKEQNAITRTYYPNGSVDDNIDEVRKELEKEEVDKIFDGVNLSDLEDSFS